MYAFGPRPSLFPVEASHALTFFPCDVARILKSGSRGSTAGKGIRSMSMPSAASCTVSCDRSEKDFQVRLLRICMVLCVRSVKFGAFLIMEVRFSLRSFVHRGNWWRQDLIASNAKLLTSGRKTGSTSRIVYLFLTDGPAELQNSAMEDLTMPLATGVEKESQASHSEQSWSRHQPRVATHFFQSQRPFFSQTSNVK